MLESDPGIKVVDVARDGKEAVDKTLETKPDLITLDVEMPKMNGLEALRLIMEKRPTPVLMVSSLTNEGAHVTLEALELGALDFIPKNLADLSVNILNIREGLVRKVKLLAKKRVRRPALVQPAVQGGKPRQAPAPSAYTRDRKLSVVAIGTSTGGPVALQQVVPQLPAGFPVGVVIAQHMPAAFTATFAERLNGLSEVQVREAKHGDIVEAGTVLIAPGGRHMRVKRHGALETRVEVSDEPSGALYKPSVNELMRSVAEHYPGRSLAVILTGMGDDGREGVRAIKEGGGKVFAQDEDSCVVYGMPRAVVDSGLADKIVPIDIMAGEIINAT